LKAKRVLYAHGTIKIKELKGELYFDVNYVFDSSRPFVFI